MTTTNGLLISSVWVCRACKMTFLGKISDRFPEDTTPEMVLIALVKKGADKEIIRHQCSPKKSGVADFAGVEFSED